MPDKKFILTLIAVTSAICLLQTGAHFGLLTLIAGSILLAILFTYDKESNWTKGERTIFCIVGATNGLIASGLLAPLLSR